MKMMRKKSQELHLKKWNPNKIKINPNKIKTNPNRTKTDLNMVETTISLSTKININKEANPTLVKESLIKEDIKEDIKGDIKGEINPLINNTEEITSLSIKEETITSLSTSKEAITNPSIRITSHSTSTDCLFKISNKMIIKLFVRIESICFLTDFSLFL